MSITSKTKQVAPSTGALEIILSPNSTSDDDIHGGAAEIASMVIDNSANAADTYVKAYNNASPTVGTTDPDEIWFVQAGETRRIVEIADKVRFDTALSIAAVTTGGTGGTTSPSSAVTLTMVTEDP